MGGFKFLNLNDEVRGYMLSEFLDDVKNDTYYKSKFFNNDGLKKYPELFQKAIEYGNESTLEDDLGKENYFSNNSFSSINRFSQTEFNRYYIRGVCVLALKCFGDNAKVQIYRAKQSKETRNESDEQTGRFVLASLLLNDLRTSLQPKEFPKVNSGLSVSFNP